MKSDMLSKLLTVSVLIYPIISIYAFNNHLNYGVLVIIVLLLPIFIFKGVKLVYPKYYFFFLMYLIFTRFWFGMFVDVKYILSLNIFLFIIILGVANKHFDLEYARKAYRVLAYISAIFFIVQEILLMTTGQSISGILPNIPLMFEASIDYRTLLASHIKQSSFFREPAYFAQFLLPLLGIELFDRNPNKTTKFNTLFFTVIILYGVSGVGFVGLIVIWSYWFIINFKYKIKIKHMLYLSIIVIAVLIYGNEFLNSDRGGEIKRRIDGVVMLDEEIGTSFIRVFRGYYVYNEFNFLEKLVGLNNPKLQVEKAEESKVSRFFKDELYYNGIQSILINSGLIGLLLVFLTYANLYKLNSYQGRVLIVVLISQSFIEAIFLNAHLLIYLVLAYSFHIKYIKQINSNQDEKNNVSVRNTTRSY